MRLVALISGGKDSCHNMLHSIAAGHEIVALAHLKPKNEIEELDSHMYQCVGHNAVEYFAKGLDLPLYQEEIKGAHLCDGKDYLKTTGDEVEDLYTLLKKVKANEAIEGVAVGAILSDYQRVRVENVCGRLGLTAYSYLWRRNQTELLSELIVSGTHAILIKVATLGLTPEQHLGKTLSEIFPHLIAMEKRYGLNVCGEGGEYETFTLDSPLFKEKIVIDEQIVVNHSLDAFAPVAYLQLKRMHLEAKLSKLSQKELIQENAICRPEYFLYGLGIDYQAPFVPSTTVDNTNTIESISSWGNTSILSSHCNINLSDSGWFWVSGCVTKSCADPAEEMKNSLQSIEKALMTNGLAVSDLVAVQLFVKDMQEFATLNNAYKTFFNLNPPSRVCVQVPLPNNVSFVMHSTGYKHPERDNCDEEKCLIKHMHVQSVSHWAPANIGPYSQAVQVGKFIHVAGQIGLVPSTMKMIGGGIIPECRLSLRHVHRILEAMDTTCSLKNVLSCICYVTHQTLVAPAKEEWNKVAGKTESEDNLMMSCVVVPGLPRGACVEWQVIAHCEDLQVWNWKNHDVPLIDNIETKCNFGQFNDTDGILKALCYNANGTNMLKESAIIRLFTHLIGLLTTLPEKEAVSHFKFQVYYAITGTTWSDLQNAWKKLNLTNASLCLIPVLGMECNLCVLNIFGHVFHVRKA